MRGALPDRTRAFERRRCRGEVLLVIHQHVHQKHVTIDEIRLELDGALRRAHEPSGPARPAWFICRMTLPPSVKPYAAHAAA